MFFLTYRHATLDAVSLCEGGVYRHASEAAAEAERLNAQASNAPYSTADSLAGVAFDPDALASLDAWQLVAILDSSPTPEQKADVARERIRRAVETVTAPAFVIFDDSGDIQDVGANAYSAQCLAGERSAVWHVPGNGERPYSLDAFRLQRLADAERGRDVLGRGFGIPDAWKAFADQLESHIGQGVAPHDIMAALGRIYRDAMADKRAAEESALSLREFRTDADASVSALKIERDALRKSLREAEAAESKAFAEVEKLQARNDTQAGTIKALSDSEKRLKGELADMESKYRAESLRANELTGIRATLESNIAEYRKQRDERGAQAVATATERDALRRALIAEKEAHASLDRATRPLMRELGGLTLSMLPAGSYGGSLAMAYSEARDAFTVATPGARAAAFRESE